MSTCSLSLLCAREGVGQGINETIYKLPKKENVYCWLLRGILLMKDIGCLNKLCIYLYSIVYFVN